MFFVCGRTGRTRRIGADPGSLDVNADRVPTRRRQFPISTTIYEASSLMHVVDRSEAPSIDNWHEVGGSFELVIGPGSWNEPGLKGTFSPGLFHEPGLKVHWALVPAVR
jgi:hypothetical protein